jgi:RNA recognition motif-containing protein
MEIQSDLARTVRNDRQMMKLLKGGDWGNCLDEEEKEVMFAPNPNEIRTVMARNLPRDITLKDLHAGFAFYGAIQDIYLPKNMDKSSPYYGTIRGFALIKYTTPLEAARAVAVGPLQIEKNIIMLEFAKADHAPLKTGQKDC